MKNVKSWQLKTCIFMDMDEFDEIGEGSGGDVDDLDLDDLEKEWE